MFYYYQNPKTKALLMYDTESNEIVLLKQIEVREFLCKNTDSKNIKKRKIIKDALNDDKMTRIEDHYKTIYDKQKKRKKITKDMILEIKRKNPGISNVAVGKVLGVSEATIRNKLK